MKKLAVVFLFGAASLALSADTGLIRLAKTTIDPNAPKAAYVQAPEACPTAAGQYQFIVQPEK